MGKRSEYEIEKMLKGISFSDPQHKSALRSRFTDERFELSPDELEGVSGGVMTNAYEFKKWRSEGEVGGLTWRSPGV